MVAATRAAHVPPLPSRGAGADPLVDAKHGWSSMCRSDRHVTCKTMRARCTCSCHGAKGQAPPPPLLRKVIPMTPVKKSSTRAAIALVVCDPPKSQSRSVSNAERFAPVIAELYNTLPPNTWAQLATWSGRASAHSARKRLADEWPDIEFKSSCLPNGTSGLWARIKP